MKTIFTTLLIFIICSVYSQDTFKLRQIDAIVSQINTSDLPIQRDTLIYDLPGMRIKTITFLTTIVKDGKLFKFETLVNSTVIENGVTRQMNSSSSFYYNHNKLIKVEEYIIEGEKKGEASWYYSEDKPIYYTLQSEKAEDRATLLLSMSKTMLKQIIK